MATMALAYERVMSSLSKQESEAAQVFLSKLTARELPIVIRDIAKEAKVSQPVFTRLVRLFEVAGLIETACMGRRGTFVYVLWDGLLKADAA